MTCYECIHINVCKAYEPEEADCICNQFKNKADFVEVVRCKDCRNRIEKNWAKCAGRKPDDFCSDGIRK